jgi:predicted RND superfamily exporter protein
MEKKNLMTHFFFDRLILRHPVVVLACIFVTVGILAYHAKDFKLDASAETLVLENDADLRYTRLINARYGQTDLLALAYTARGDLFSDTSLAQLARMRDELAALKNVASVVTILDVPLLESPPLSLESYGKKRAS